MNYARADGSAGRSQSLSGLAGRSPYSLGDCDGVQSFEGGFDEDEYDFSKTFTVNMWNGDSLTTREGN